MALTSEEEEHRGVAATLLAPLIPSEVKEEEDVWRKRLLGGLDDKENSLDSDGERVCHPGSPAAPLREPDTPFSLSQREQRSRNQSQDNSDAEGEEPEEDTMELELALERKKASVYKAVEF